jgi:hypothetical protein
MEKNAVVDPNRFYLFVMAAPAAPQNLGIETEIVATVRGLQP